MKPLQAYCFTSYKHPHTPHRRFMASGHLRDGDCLLFVRPPRTEMEYVGQDRRLFFELPSLEFVWPGRGYKLAIWFPSQREIGGYFDVCLPPVVDEGQRTVDFLDLDLDLAVAGDGQELRCTVLDQDEFRRRARAYPRTLASFAQAALEGARALVAARNYPFDRSPDAWRLRLAAMLSKLD